MKTLLAAAALLALPACTGAPPGPPADVATTTRPGAPVASLASAPAPPLATPAPTAALTGPDSAAASAPVPAASAAPAAIQETLSRERARFRGCFEETLGRGAHPAARVVARFTIGVDGAVTQAAGVEGSFAREELVTCVLAALRAVRFDPPEKGPLQVVYPFGW